MFVVVNILCFYWSQSENSWISWATPTNTSMIVAFVAMILCSIVPETLYWKVISFEHNTMPEKQKYMLKIGPFSIIKEIAIRGFVIKNFGLLFATKFIFDLLYLHWFK